MDVYSHMLPGMQQDAIGKLNKLVGINVKKDLASLSSLSKKLDRLIAEDSLVIEKSEPFVRASGQHQ